MNTGQPLSDLAASLLSELARSAAEAERRQRTAYAELAAEIAVPADVHEERTAGATPEEQEDIAASEAERLGLRCPKGHTDVYLLDPAARVRLAEELDGVVADIDGRECTIYAALSSPEIPRRTLFALIIAALRRKARRRYLQTRTLLQDGLPHATLTGGHVTAKVVLDSGKDGAIVARLANEGNVEKNSSETISTITFDFTLGAFPSIR